MKKISLLLLVAFVAASCNGRCCDGIPEEPNTCGNAKCVNSVPVTRVEDNNLVVETSGRVVRVMGEPGTRYQYRVWTGDKDTATNDPDVVVHDGEIYVPETAAAPVPVEPTPDADTVVVTESGVVVGAPTELTAE